MNPLFAEATPSANMILLVLVFLVTVGSGLATIGQWWQGRGKQKREISPQPFEVSKSPKRYNHEAIDGRIKTVESKVHEHDQEIAILRDKFFDELPDMERRLNSAGEERSSEIHKRINDILREVSNLGGKMEGKE